MFFSLTEIVSGSVAGQISSDSSNVVELIEVRAGSYLHLLFTLSKLDICPCVVCDQATTVYNEGII